MRGRARWADCSGERWGRLSEPAWDWAANHPGTQARSESPPHFQTKLFRRPLKGTDSVDASGSGLHGQRGSFIRAA
jgi:hypothetical protein